MAEVRYQVFISTTTRAFRETRHEVVDALIASSYIPSGAELPSAAGEPAWPSVQRSIDNSDYCLIIVTGDRDAQRADSTPFVEAEYEYARSLSKPVLAFLYDGDTAGSGLTAEERSRAEAFRARLEDEVACQEFESSKELALQVIAALNPEVSYNPGVGWVRADSVVAEPSEVQDDIVAPAKALGISRISADGAAGRAMDVALAGAQQIRIMSTSAVRLLEIQLPNLVRAVIAGADLRVLVPMADDTFVDDVKEMEGSRGDHNQISAEIQQVVARLRQVLQLARERGSERIGTVRAGYYTTHLRSTLVLCDDSWGWLTITLPPARTTQTASFELAGGTSTTLLADCVRHFDRVWEVVESRSVTTLLV